MSQAYIVTGTLSDGRTVALDEPIGLDSSRVRLVIEPLENGDPRDRDAVMREIWRGQVIRGHQPPSRADVDGWLDAERDSWR